MWSKLQRTEMRDTRACSSSSSSSSSRCYLVLVHAVYHNARRRSRLRSVAFQVAVHTFGRVYTKRVSMCKGMFGGGVAAHGIFSVGVSNCQVPVS